VGRRRAQALSIVCPGQLTLLGAPPAGASSP
jgi:hypothetical protein